MSIALALGCLWILAATGVALLPMRHQYAPGLALMIAAPVLIVWLGFQHGALVAILATLAFLSMFRHPLRYFWNRARGLSVEPRKGPEA